MPTPTNTSNWPNNICCEDATRSFFHTNAKENTIQKSFWLLVLCCTTLFVVVSSAAAAPRYIKVFNDTGQKLTLIGCTDGSSNGQIELAAGSDGELGINQKTDTQIKIKSTDGTLNHKFTVTPVDHNAGYLLQLKDGKIVVIQ